MKREAAADPRQRWDLSDRGLMVAFGISLGLHLLLLVGQVLSIDWIRPLALRRAAVNVVYDYEIAQQEVHRLEERMRWAKRDAMAVPFTPSVGEQGHVRIPERPSLSSDQTLAQVMPGRSAMVDLTNLVEASRGDPVLLTYFSAIRQQIQQAANARAWLTGESAQGLVYVSFALQSTGAVQRIEVVADRSVASTTLQEIARRIVKSAAPFPPFPPSISEANKLIVVPLEFLFGS